MGGVFDSKALFAIEKKTKRTPALRLLCTVISNEDVVSGASLCR